MMRVKSGRSHLRRNKSKQVKRLYGDIIPLHPSDVSRIKRVLPR